MKITFKKAEVAHLVAATKSAATCTVPYTGEGWGVPEETTPGICVIGDAGIYMMSNRTSDEGSANHINEATGGDQRNAAYAQECDPQSVESCYDTKREAFGDDGVEFIELDTIQEWIDKTPGDILKMNMTPDSLSFLFVSSPSARVR